MPQSVTPKKIESVKLYSKAYDKFRGVDFSTDPTQVADYRSPYALNLISDLAGFPEKRPGWRKLQQRQGRINGMHYAVFASGASMRFVHAAKKLFTWDGVEIFSDMADVRSTAFAHGGRLYIMDGEKYRVVTESDGVYTVANVEDGEVFVPTTTIAAAPSGGGTPFEAVNMLTGKRINSFFSNGTSKDYFLDTQNIDAVTKVVVNGEEKDNYTVDLAAGKVSLSAAPADSEGVDNVVIHFTANVEGYADRVNKCTIFAFFGFNSDNRIFISGNPEYPNWDWQSGLDDPTYFPDTGYTKIGSDTSAVMGYLKQYNSLTIVKTDNEQDAEVFLRTAQMEDDGSIIFPLQQGIKGVGAISKHAFANLRDDPLFLAKEGVFAIASTSVQLERTVQDRSYFVNPVLTTEANLSEAVAAVWNGYYVLCINGRAYVADSRKRTAQSGTGANYSESGSYIQYSYEWYYWQNIPARVIYEFEGELWFGTDDGYVCKFNTDISTMARYNDDGAAILARWATKMDDYGTIVRRKTLTKKGCGVMIKPYTRSSVTVYTSTDRTHEAKIQYATMDILDFSDIDFSRITFNTLDTPQVVPLNKKVKKFIVLQLIFENNVKDEGFGIYGVQTQYAVSGYVK